MMSVIHPKYIQARLLDEHPMYIYVVLGNITAFKCFQGKQLHTWKSEAPK